MWTVSRHSNEWSNEGHENTRIMERRAEDRRGGRRLTLHLTGSCSNWFKPKGHRDISRSQGYFMKSETAAKIERRMEGRELCSLPLPPHLYFFLSSLQRATLSLKDQQKLTSSPESGSKNVHMIVLLVQGSTSIYQLWASGWSRKVEIWLLTVTSVAGRTALESRCHAGKVAQELQSTPALSRAMEPYQEGTTWRTGAVSVLRSKVPSGYENGLPKLKRFLRDSVGDKVASGAMGCSVSEEAPKDTMGGAQACYLLSRR